MLVLVGSLLAYVCRCAPGIKIGMRTDGGGKDPKQLGRRWPKYHPFIPNFNTRELLIASYKAKSQSWNLNPTRDPGPDSYERFFKQYRPTIEKHLFTWGPAGLFEKSTRVSTTHFMPQLGTSIGIFFIKKIFTPIGRYWYWIFVRISNRYWSLVLGFKAEFWLTCESYILGIEILYIYTSYYLKSQQGRY